MHHDQPGFITHSDQKSGSSRLVIIDALRILAALAIVFIHAKPYTDSVYDNTIYSVVRDVIIQFSRFAVPFFFIVAGCFLRRRLDSPEYALEKTWPYIRRIIWFYLIWSALYLCFPPHWFTLLLEGNIKPFYWHLYNSFRLLTETPVVFLFKSTGVHLWFLPALAIAVSALALAVRYRLGGLFMVSATGLYAMGMLSEAYSRTPLGLALDSRLVLGFCYAPLFVGLGWWVAGHAKVSLTTAIIIAGFGFALQLFEASWLAHEFGQSMLVTSYVFGTVPFGLGLAMLGLSRPAWRGNPTLSRLGGMTLGIYLIHIWVKSLLKPVKNMFSGPFMELAFPLLIFCVSLLLVLWLSRTRYHRLFACAHHEQHFLNARYGARQPWIHRESGIAHDRLYFIHTCLP